MPPVCEQAREARLKDVDAVIKKVRLCGGKLTTVELSDGRTVTIKPCKIAIDKRHIQSTSFGDTYRAILDLRISELLDEEKEFTVGVIGKNTMVVCKFQ